MTAYTSTGRPQFIRTVTSEEVAKTATITLDLSTDGDFQALTHVFLGVQMFDAGGNLIDDSAGSFAVTIQSVNTQRDEAPTVATINATSPSTLTWALNTYKIVVVPSSLSATVTWRVVATANRN